ncbi:hypothetical protein L9F63_023219, partial [Diploptera punctata]
FSLLIGATNRPESLDPALRSAGRFDREVCLGIPDKDARKEILQILCKDLHLSTEFDYEFLAKNTPGYVGADLKELIREAKMVSLERTLQNSKGKKTAVTKKSEEKTSEAVDIVEEKPDSIEASAVSSVTSTKNDKTENSTNQPTSGCNVELSELRVWFKKDTKPLSDTQLKGIKIEMDDFKQALKCVQPSAKREGFATVPDVTWDDVGSLTDIREQLQLTILAPVRYPELYAKMGIPSSSGVLLCGPPGCGKTLLAKAVANESGINFISVKGPELLNMYVGESERAVRQCFQRAKNSAPCVIFFDELDAFCVQTGQILEKNSHYEGGASTRVVNMLLAEMDGTGSRKDVFLLGATNRPEMIDPAILRPGRLDKILYIGLPTPADRVEILKTLTKNGTSPLLSEDVDLQALGESSQLSGFTGADLKALVREAAVEVMKEVMNNTRDPNDLTVSNKHFQAALKNISPSVSEKDQKRYEMLKKEYVSNHNGAE